jgi:VIT1/CCC1 family predicted Fe2+/Mn2+ transporter
MLEGARARPVQAALTSAGTFAVGAALPLSIVLVVPRGALIGAVAGSAIVFLGLLGAVGARIGGAKIGRATIRVTFWGALAMALTAAIGAVFGAVV